MSYSLYFVIGLDDLGFVIGTIDTNIYNFWNIQSWKSLKQGPV